MPSNYRSDWAYKIITFFLNFVWFSTDIFRYESYLRWGPGVLLILFY